jgi:hypothetical protein
LALIIHPVQEIIIVEIHPDPAQPPSNIYIQEITWNTKGEILQYSQDEFKIILYALRLDNNSQYLFTDGNSFNIYFHHVSYQTLGFNGSLYSRLWLKREVPNSNKTIDFEELYIIYLE